MSNELEAELQQLVPLAQQGDRAALQRILSLINPPLVRYVRARMQGNPYPTVEDVVQDTLLAVMRSLPRYQDQGKPFMAFAYSIASNKTNDAFRAMSRDHMVPTEELPESTSFEPSPEDLAISADPRNTYVRLLDQLNETSRQVIILRVIEGLSAEESAAILGCTPGALRVRQSRAMNTLRKLIEQQEQQ